MSDLKARDLDTGFPAVLEFETDELATYEYQRVFRRLTPLEPEHRLMLAVLEDAIICLQRYRNAKSGKQRRWYREAVEWVTDRSDQGVFSFENVCAFCGLDAAYLRLGLSKWINETNTTARIQLRQPSRSKMRPWGMRGYRR